MEKTLVYLYYILNISEKEFGNAQRALRFRFQTPSQTSYPSCLFVKNRKVSVKSGNRSVLMTRSSIRKTLSRFSRVYIVRHSTFLQVDVQVRNVACSWNEGATTHGPKYRVYKENTQWINPQFSLYYIQILGETNSNSVQEHPLLSSSPQIDK